MPDTNTNSNEIRVISSEDINILRIESNKSSRLRKSLNLHEGSEESPQVLINHLCKDTYIRPHKHHNLQNIEYLVCISGAVIT